MFEVVGHLPLFEILGRAIIIIIFSIHYLVLVLVMVLVCGMRCIDILVSSEPYLNHSSG